MPKWKTIRVKQELVEEAKKEVEKSQYQSLSEFVSEAIRLRLQTLAKESIPEYLERDEQSRILQIQGQLLYTPKHIWAKLTLQGNIRLGVSNYFQSQLEGIVRVETVNVGEKITKEEPFGMVETIAWMWIHDLYSPVEGKIVEVNKAIIEDPFILNGNPHQWIVEIQPNNPQFHKELDKLLNFEEYKKLIAQLGEPGSPRALNDPKLNEIIKEIKRSA